MTYFKENIWKLFYVIALLGFITVSIISYNLWDQIYSNTKLKQENITKISATSINSLFTQYEMIVDILGNELLENDNYKSKQISTRIFDKFLKVHSDIPAFGLVGIDGNTLSHSSNVNGKKLKNLLENKITKDSFLQTLNSKSMVLGRSYYHEILKTLVIPIRKTIRDENNKVIGVLVAALKIDKGDTLFNQQLRDSKIYKMALFRGIDSYFQLLPNNTKKNIKLYQKPFPDLKVEKVKHVVKSNYGKNVDYYKKNEKVITLKIKKFDAGKTYLFSFRYIKKYGLWIIIESPYSFMINMFYETFILILLVYIILSFIGFFVFKYIVNFEKQKRNELEYQANHDYLTHLHNRMYLSRIEYVLTKDQSKPFSLFFIDMDNFKSINDNYGHLIGDKVLQEISKRLKYISKTNDTLIRYSGDEFILIVNEINTDKINKLAQSILDSLSKTYFIDKYNFTLGSSIGVSQFPKDALSIDKIKSYADLSMYEAKKEKNTYCIFETSIKNRYKKVNEIEHELQTALGKNEFFMMYQPQINQDGSIHGVEALVRWNNKKLGFVSPEQFIKVVEDTGFMPKLGKFIMDTSFGEIIQLQNELNISFHLSINISVKQFMEVNFYDNFLNFIEKNKFKKEFITLEITENIFIEDINFIFDLLNKFKKQNIKISLDDFGTGYSSLSLLKQLPIDELKIDKSFVDDITESKTSKNMVESIISMGKSLGFYIVAEGIETKEQKNLLKSLNCDIFQGYYYSKPLKINDLKEYIISFNALNKKL